ncbi:gem-associated protein 2-like, partial [Saccostrea cucullata]|uniref:gem-associated protein 2-like n=1 Tax=Saccostrea cuccullata TaxID=36930 RepID=UPI002ED377F2
MESDDSLVDDELQPQALAVSVEDNDDFDLNIPPTSGNEYLRRVREEAKDCPQIVVADIDTSPFLHRQTVKIREYGGQFPAPKGYTPDLQWQKMQTANFAELRQKLQRQKVLMAKKGLLKRDKL